MNQSLRLTPLILVDLFRKLTITLEVPDTSGLVKKANYNAKITEIKAKIPSITDLATTAVFNVVDNQIPNISDLVNKTDYNVKILDIETKYFTKCDYNKFTGKILNAKIEQKELVDKSGIYGFIDNSDVDKKIATKE